MILEDLLEAIRIFNDSNTMIFINSPSYYMDDQVYHSYFRGDKVLYENVTQLTMLTMPKIKEMLSNNNLLCKTVTSIDFTGSAVVICID